MDAQQSFDFIASVSAGFVLMALWFYLAWRFANRKWLKQLYREVDGNRIMNSHVYVWIRHQRKQ